MAFLHEEFTDEEIRDVLRLAARQRAAGKGHPVATEARFVRTSNVVLEPKPDGTYGAAVSWEDE